MQIENTIRTHNTCKCDKLDLQIIFSVINNKCVNMDFHYIPFKVDIPQTILYYPVLLPIQIKELKKVFSPCCMRCNITPAFFPQSF